MEQNDNTNLHIKMFKGYDKNSNPFTAICLLTDKEQKELINDFYGSINLTKYNIIYKQFGHNLDEKIINDIKEYCDRTNYKRH
jgi:hypothetical protein